MLEGPILFTFVFLLVFFTIKKIFKWVVIFINFLINNFFIYFSLYHTSYFIFLFIQKKILYTLFSLSILLCILDHIFLWSRDLSSLTHQNFLQDHLIKN